MHTIGRIALTLLVLFMCISVMGLLNVALSDDDKLWYRNHILVLAAAVDGSILVILAVVMALSYIWEN